MYKIIFFLALLPSILFIGCSKQNNTPIVNEEKTQQIDYLMNPDLSSKEYADIEGSIPQEGFISSPEIAAKIAEIVWTAKYPKANIQNEKPFSVKLENDIWIIEGYWDKEDHDTFGGVAYMEIRKSNGEILKVIHGK
ncbi:hypothetical protein AGMMS4957_22350 [Bacteroidia bacterium]|nr:hypothetical protein AGMMS4957_22350 [Bacteroidia bacterium]